MEEHTIQWTKEAYFEKDGSKRVRSLSRSVHGRQQEERREARIHQAGIGAGDRERDEPDRTEEGTQIHTDCYRRSDPSGDHLVNGVGVPIPRVSNSSPRPR